MSGRKVTSDSANRIHTLISKNLRAAGTCLSGVAMKGTQLSMATTCSVICVKLKYSNRDTTDFGRLSEVRLRMPIDARKKDDAMPMSPSSTVPRFPTDVRIPSAVQHTMGQTMLSTASCDRR